MADASSGYLVRRLFLLCLPLVLGCYEDVFYIDPFPIEFDTSTGPVIVGASFTDNEPARITVVDTLSPITLFEPFPDRPGVQQKLQTITLFTRNSSGQFGVPRARFPLSAGFETRLCEGPPGSCVVGSLAASTPVTALVGGDLLGRASARFDFPNHLLTLFPNLAGADIDLTRQCDAVFNRPYGGGGTVHVGDADVRFVGVRPAVSACLDVEAAPTDVIRGVDALFAISTGIGSSIIAASAYDRYAVATAAPPRASLPAGQVLLASGPIPARIGSIGQFALVGEGSRQRGPCQELYANRVLARDLCVRAPELIPACPCEDNETFCRTGAAVVVNQALEVAVVDDEQPFLQALREELRPTFPDADGILGTNALALLRAEFDYPGNRVVFRCSDPTLCLTRPQVRDRSELDRVATCLARSVLN